MFSERTDWPQTQTPLALAAAEKKRSGRKFLDLTLSNPTLCGFDYPKKFPFQTLDHPENLLYEPDPRGLPAAREAVCRYYAKKGVRVSPERIFLTSSTSEAYSFLFRLLADPGGVVLAPKPGYPLFDHLCGLNDLKLEKYSLAYDRFWKLDPVSLARFPQAKALIWVNPNNPTGNFAGLDERDALARFARSRGCALVVDEVFLDFPWTSGKSMPSFAAESRTLTFVLSGISKVLGLPQMKLSWMVVGGPEAEAAEASRRLEIIADAYLSVNTPVQRALPAWLESSPVAVQEILTRVRKNYIRLLETAASTPGLEVMNGDGGWHAVLRVKGADDEKYCLRLLNERNVLAHPGYLFDFEEDNCIVVSLLLPHDEFMEGMRALAP